MLKKMHMGRVTPWGLALCAALLLAGCSSNSSSSPAQAAGQAPPQGNLQADNPNQIMGLFSSASDDSLVIELIDMPEMAGGTAPDGGDFPGGGSLPEGIPDRSGGSLGPGEGSRPEMQPPDGASFPANDERPEGFSPPGGNFETTGETKKIKVTNSTAITVMGSNESLTLNNLSPGELLTIVLDEDEATAISITVMRQTRGAQGT